MQTVKDGDLTIDNMANTYIDTNTLPHTKVPARGEYVEVLNNALCGAKNVVGSLRWLSLVTSTTRRPTRKHKSAGVPDGGRGDDHARRQGPSGGEGQRHLSGSG